MNKVMKLVGTALAGGVTAFFLATATLTVPACGPEEEPGGGQTQAKCEVGDVGCCTKASDCGKASEFVCASKTCIAICTRSDQCPGDEICEDAVCRAPACGNDAECKAGEQCIGGACEAKIGEGAVASCQVLPTGTILKDGAKKSFSIVAKDADGKVVAYKGDVAYSVDEADRAAVDGAVVTGGSEAGAVKVQAKVGTVDCAAANVVNYAAPANGKRRVVVADLNTQKPIKGASVVIGTESVDTNDDGIVEFDGAAETVTVSVFHDDYAWVTIVDAKSKDLLVYTKKAQQPAKFTGSMTARDFDGLSDIQGNVRLALQGSSIAGNLFDLELATLLGEMEPTDIKLGGSLDVDAVPLPAGTVIGLSETMFRGPQKANGEPGFSIVAAPGVRTLWALGGNAQISDIIEAAGPAIGGEGDIEVGPILSGLLPVIGRLQSGALTGLNAVEGETASIMKDGKSQLKLDTLLRLRVNAKLPKLPTYTAGNTEVKFGEAIVLGGAFNGSQGLVPMGLTAGIDGDGDGIVDGDADAGTQPGNLELRMAPLHSGMETSKYAVVALAASLESLIGGDAGLALSGVVSYPDTLKFDGGKPQTVEMSSFLSVPSNASVEASNRTVKAGSKVDGAAFQRLSIGEGDAEWLVYFEPGADREIVLPNGHEGKHDRFKKKPGESNAKDPQLLLHSVRLGLGGAAPSFDDVVSFGSHNLDDLSAQVDAFSVLELQR